MIPFRDLQKDWNKQGGRYGYPGQPSCVQNCTMMLLQSHAVLPDEVLWHLIDLILAIVSICFLIDFAALLYAKGFKLLALDREGTTNTATSC